MDLKDYIEKITFEKDDTKVYENAKDCAHYCINNLNLLVMKKTSGKKQLELNDDLNTIYQQLFGYLNNDKRIDQVKIHGGVQNWSREKGILFIGKYGSGKTLILDFLKQVKGKFKIEGVHTTAFEICKEFQFAQQNPKYEGYEQILNRGCLFIDEVGDEPKVSKSYGNEENVIYRTLKTKFDRIENQPHKERVFMTSNLNGDDFIERYGERLWDRIKGNMNVVFLGISENHKSHRE